MSDFWNTFHNYRVSQSKVLFTNIYFSLFFAADWNLEIDPVGIADDGKYQCQVTPQRYENKVK